MSQVACAQAKTASMQAQNEADKQAGRSSTYQPFDFDAVPDKFGISHNAVIIFFRD